MFDIKEELKKLPQKPGVYIMKDNTDNIIYIGKAISLKNRVRQYFQSTKNQPPKVQKMVPNIKEFEYIVTDSELEALILECTLIKKHKPKYNILLKDDRQYPYIKITVNEEYPRIFVARKMEKDGAKYYGPFTNSTSVKEFIELVHYLFPIRKCNKPILNDGKRPCLNYHINQCKAPCNNLISSQDYRVYIDRAIEILDGKYNSTIDFLNSKMLEASENLDFEKAAQYRDKINSIKRVAEKQKMINSSMEDQDVIAFARAHGESLIQIFFVRGGKILGREHFLLSDTESMSRSEVMTEFVKEFYGGTSFIPKEILLQESLQDVDMIQLWLSGLKGQKVYINVPKKGEKHELVELVAKNAMITLEQFGEKIKRDSQKIKTALEDIKKLFPEDISLNRIEAYDISNIQGFEAVGSMVVFENGIPKRSDYRKFKIKSVIGPNDYASMEEVIERRFKHALKEIEELKSKNIDLSEGKFAKLPDIIFMDGGKGQINSAKKVLSQLNIYIPVCGMVKDEHHRTRALIYNENEIVLPTNSEGFKLITRIQDEVHRFAIEYHRTLRTDKQMHSILDDIDGIGPARRKSLLKHFGTLESIANANVEQLSSVKNMNLKTAQTVYDFFHKSN